MSGRAADPIAVAAWPSIRRPGLRSICATCTRAMPSARRGQVVSGPNRGGRVGRPLGAETDEWVRVGLAHHGQRGEQKRIGYDGQPIVLQPLVQGVPHPETVCG